MPYKDLAIKKLYHSEYNKNLSEQQKINKKENSRLWWSSPKGKYSLHKYRAARQNIPWEFTFETWWKMWEDSGKYNFRGSGKDMYCMCRYKDEGAYSPSNVYIAKTEENKRDAWLNNKLRLPTGQLYSELYHKDCSNS